MKRKKKGFTLVELLTVLGIIALLVGLLIPALSLVRNVARETKQRAQLVTIDQALMAFRSDSDYGDYPESDNDDLDYCGAQKLAEALLGWDMLGFHPDSAWLSSGEDGFGSLVYDSSDDDNLDERIGPYLELATANAFTLNQLFGVGNTDSLAGDTFVICDSFTLKKITIGEQTFKAGLPILYYRADPPKKKFDGIGGMPPGSKDIYNFNDNFTLIKVADLEDGVLGGHPLFSAPGYPAGMYFYSEDYKILDQKVLDATGRPWPYRADSYILISAGVDGLYGTSDDICNFGN